MDIIVSLHDLGFEADNIEELHKKVLEFYTKDGISADVKIVGDTVHVHFTEQEIAEAQRQIQKVRDLCDAHKFTEAKAILEKFLKKHPFHSEAYRLLAQITREEGDPNKALDILLDALRTDPKNIWALMLMGNVFNQDLHNFDTAMKYYNRVLEYFPDNAIAINNIAAVHAEQNNYDEAKHLFKSVIELDPSYENAYYGLASIYYDQKLFEKAFEIARRGCVEGVRRPENPKVTELLRKLMLASAQALTEYVGFKDIYLGIKDILEEEYDAEVREEADPSLQVFAQLQYGPTRGRRWHLLKYNPKHPFIPHLQVHELMHLDMTLEANKKGLGAQIVHSTTENEGKFRSKFAAWAKQLTNKFGYTKAQEIVGQVMNGLMVQLMNCPLDLFVEKRMFDKYKSMRPMQCLSLLQQEETNIHAIEGTMKNNFLPLPIVRASKIMNIVTSMHFEKLYGIRLYQYYKPTKAEFDTAKDLYEEYEAYHDYTPGEEYELIKFFAETLGLEEFISFAPDNKTDFFWDSKEKEQETKDFRDAVIGDQVDPVDGDTGNSIDGLSEAQKKRQDTFYEKHKDGADPAQTMMMAMYMLGALERFEDKPKEFIQKVAFEIATIGMRGISPEVGDYVVHSLGDMKMGGYQLLANYYVSWKLFNPEMHKSLQLPFDAAWETAQQLYQARKGGKK